MRAFRLLLTALVCVVARRGEAQAVVSGYVYDSLRTKAPLVDATVVITELNLFAATDVSGHFSFPQKIPVGTWSVTFLHPVLDSLSVAAGTQRLVIADSGAPLLRLATPSPATFVRQVCPNAEPETGVVIGAVRDASTGKPIAGAKIETEWAEIEVLRGMKRVARSTETRSAASGGYVLCYVPTDISTELHAELDSTRTGPVEIFLNDRSILRRDFALNSGGVGRTTISGTVRGMNGKPAANAIVSIGPGLASTRTDAAGHYAIPGAPSGTQLIEARIIGARPVRSSVDLVTDVPQVLDFDLKNAAVELPTVAISGKQTARGRFAEFAERQKRGFGRFITSADIDKKQPVDLVALLQSAGLIYNISRNGQRNLFMRGSSTNSCAPTYFVDGMRWMNAPGGAGGAMSGGGSAGPSTVEDLSSFFRPADIRGVEVYPGFGSIPAQYDPANGCGIILIWTR